MHDEEIKFWKIKNMKNVIAAINNTHFNIWITGQFHENKVVQITIVQG